MPEAKALRMKGPRSSLLHMAEERRSWSSLSPESSPFAGITFRRGGLEGFIVGVAVSIGENLGIYEKMNCRTSIFLDTS